MSSNLLTTRDVRLYDSSPTPDNQSRVEIGWLAAIATQAAKLVSCRPILLSDMAALGTLTRGVSSVNGPLDDTNALRLVGNKTAKLEECPRMQRVSLFSPNRYPVADALEILKGHSTSGAFGKIHDLLADHVIRICGEAALFARELFESALRRFGAFLLKFSSQPHVPVPDVADMGAGVVVAVRIRGYVFHSKI
jgi:hypothetical protein